MSTQFVNVPGYNKMPMNIWGKATLLLNLLYREGLLPDCHIAYHENEEGGEYKINSIRVGNTEEEVTTSIWRMAEVYHAEGHIDFEDTGTNNSNPLAPA